MSPLATVELPSGVRHCCTTAKAESWEAWNALTDEGGWTEDIWEIAGESISDAYPAGLHQQKEAVIRGHRIVVFPPKQPQTRAAVAA